MIWLSGCATPSVISACPEVKSYSREFNLQLAAEVERAGPAVVEAITDYYVLWHQVEACRKAKQ